jgi:hypothetical protein
MLKNAVGLLPVLPRTGKAWEGSLHTLSHVILAKVGSCRPFGLTDWQGKDPSRLSRD